jgi:hypothetical protein
MAWRWLALLAVLAGAECARAQDLPRLPTGRKAPELCYATASGTDKGPVQLRLLRAYDPTPPRSPHEEITGLGLGLRGQPKPLIWMESTAAVEPKGVRVVELNGKAADSEGLPKRLAAFTPVLLAHDEMPDAHYLQTAKEGTLLVIVPSGVLGGGLSWKAVADPTEEKK